MEINKRQKYLIGLVIASTLSVNIQTVSALTTEPMSELEGSATLLTTVQIIPPTSALDSIFAPVVTTGLYIFNGNQYEPNTLFVPPSHYTNARDLFPNYDGGLLKDTDKISVKIEAVVGSFTVSKSEKTPVAANKVYVSSQHDYEIKATSITSREIISIPVESQPEKIQPSPDQNPLYLANSQHIRRGTLVSTNYNTVSMLRTMEDLQNIGYLGMNDVNAEPISDTLTRELKLTTQIAFVPDNLCANLVDFKLSAACQDKNVGKTAAIPIIHQKNWSAQMQKDFSFWQSVNGVDQKANR